MSYGYEQYLPGDDDDGEDDELAKKRRKARPGGFDESQISEAIVNAKLREQYCWTSGAGWLYWTGTVWKHCADEAVVEELRAYCVSRYTGATGPDREAWHSTLSASRLSKIERLARGQLLKELADFDKNPDLLNTPTGIVDLRTGELHEHRSDYLMTKITSGSYIPGFKHPDWEKALEAIPDKETRDWLQTRFGQAVTGRPTPDGTLYILQGSGENGKSAFTTDGIIPALGGYASVAPAGLIGSKQSDEAKKHMIFLKGRRLIVAEEMTEGRALDITTLKRIQDVTRLTGWVLYKGDEEFDATHSLFATTNYRPSVSETDHGTWRRLALVEFPYTFRKPGEPRPLDTDKEGDPGLKPRVKGNVSGQHDAIVTWCVEGALRLHASTVTPPTPTMVRASTDSWRAEVDHIQGGWLELWEPAPADEPGMKGEELLKGFNSWLKSKGNQPWSLETFTMRFGAHQLTKSHGVHKTKNPIAVKRMVGMDVDADGDHITIRPKYVKEKNRVWKGVRLRQGEEVDL